MNTSILKTSITAALGAAILCGCASQSSTTPAANPTAAQAATPPTARAISQKPLPRNPTIDAYVGAMRADLSDGKIKIVNSVMKLSVDEGKVFWPIYEEYESELFDLGDQRVDLIRRFAAAQQSGKLEQARATELADGYFKFEQQRLDLMKKYNDVIAKELSPIRAAQFTQIEHRVGTIIDLTIASELPLLVGAPTAAKP